MQGASRSALSATRKTLAEALDQADRAALAEELLAISAVIGGNAILLRALADPSREGKKKAGVVQRLFGDKVSDLARAVTTSAVTQRWTRERDLREALEHVGFEALLAQAQREGRLDRVEDELFRFERIVAGNPRLRTAISDPRPGPQAKRELVQSLLSGKAAPETVRLAEHAATMVPRRRFDHTVASYVGIAARMQEQLSVTVTSAVPLDVHQVDRLTAALSEEYGHPVSANMIIDPAVMGGIRVEVGDEVIDGTILSRLHDARRRLTS